MARLLTPEDYGLTAIIVSIISIGEIFREMGLSTASIQSKSISRGEKTNLFWVNVFVGSILTLALFSLSSILAEVYGEPRLEPIAQALSVTFLINGATAQFKAGLTRDLRFNAIAFGDALAALLTVSVGVWFALKGHGYWAIVYQQIAQYCYLLLYYIFLSKWTPTTPNFNVSIRSFLKYGMSLSASQLINQFSRSIDTLVIGHRFGVDILGFYNRAQQVVFMAANQIGPPATSLATPVLSKLQDDNDEFFRFLKTGQSVLLQLSCFAFAFLAINSEIIISIVLGAKWLPSTELLQLLSIWGIFYTAEYPLYWIYLTRGLMKEQLQFTVISRLILVSIILIGSLWSVYTIAVCLVLGQVTVWVSSAYNLSKVLKDSKNQFNGLLYSSFAVGGSYLAVIFAVILLGDISGTKGVTLVLLQNFLCILLIACFYLFNYRFKQSVDIAIKLIRAKV